MSEERAATKPEVGEFDGVLAEVERLSTEIGGWVVTAPGRAELEEIRRLREMVTEVMTPRYRFFCTT